MVLKGKQKNQTEKKKFTIVVYLNESHGNYEIDRREVVAENVREAIRMAFSNIFNQ